MTWCQLLCNLAFSMTLTAGISDDQALDFQKGLFLLEQSRDFSHAAILFESLQDKNPENTQFAFFLGKTYYRLGRYDDAIGKFESCLAKEENNKIYLIWCGKAYGRKLGQLHQQGKTSAVIAMGKKLKATVKKCIKIAPDCIDAQIAMAVFLRETPGIFGGSVSKSKKMLTSLIKQYPECINARYSIAELYLKKEKELDQAISEYMWVARQSGTPGITYEDQQKCNIALLHVGFIYYKRDKNYEKASDYITRHLDAIPDSLLGHITMGEIMVKEERFKEAKQELTMAKSLAEAQEAKKNIKSIKSLLRNVDRKLSRNKRR
jgi:tetratricopeptide (TPR) repeat protein